MLRMPQGFGMNSRWQCVRLASQSWQSFRCATSRSRFTMTKTGSCERQCRAARRAARRQPVSLASSKKRSSTTPTSMTMPSCLTCSASLGRASRSTVPSAGIPRIARLHPSALQLCRTVFGATRLGMRVIVAPGNVGPVAIDHPALFQPKTGQVAAAAAAAAKAEEATGKADQARLVAITASRESALAMVSVRKAETLKLKAETELAAAERAIASAASREAKEQAEGAKAKVTARIGELEAQLV